MAYNERQEINYLKNDIADRKSDINMNGNATMGDRISPLSYSGNNIKLQSGINMNDESAGQERKNLLADNPVDTNAAMMMKKEVSPAYNVNEGYGSQIGKPSVASRNKYGGNKGDESMSDRDYSAPTKMYGGKKENRSKSRIDY